MPEDLFDLMGGKEQIPITRTDWMIGMNAIVAKNDDPEHRHRIKVIIPSIDEHKIHDKWINRMVWWTGQPGYGDFHIPEINSEVLLFGRNSEKYHIFYVSRFNEEHLVPRDFWRPPDTRGFRTDGDYKAIVSLDYQIRSGRLLIETDATARIIAPGGFFINNKRVG
jgi:Type VI secretion system/phage-baseplate injector OB domain